MKTINLHALTTAMRDDWIDRFAGKDVVIDGRTIISGAEDSYLTQFEIDALIEVNGGASDVTRIFRIPTALEQAAMSLDTEARKADDQAMKTAAAAGNPWHPASFNLPRQILIEKESPAIAARLKAAA